MAKKMKTSIVSEEDALEIVGRAVDKAIGSLKQKIAASIDSKINSILREFTDGVATRIHQQYEQVDRQRSYLDFLVMPNGTRLFRSTPDRSVLVMEHPPAVRTLCIPEGFCLPDPDSVGSYTPRSYALPYTVWIFPVSIDSSKRWQLAGKAFMGWSKKPIRTVDDEIHVPILPNVNDDYSICMGETSGQYNGSNDLCKFTDEFVKTFWQSEFSRDYNRQYLWAAQRHPQFFKTLESWANASRRDASFMVTDKVEFYPNALSVGTLVGNLLSRDDNINHHRTSLLRSSIQSVIKDESWALTESIREYLDTLDISTLHKGKQEARIVREYMDQFVAQACDKVRETWDAEMRATLDEVERRQEALAAKILSEDGKNTTRHFVPKVGGCDLTNPW